MFDYMKALYIMLKAHRGQKDKGGKPYFLHPLRVSKQLSNKKEKIVALLHDVLEDSNFTIDDLAFLDIEQKKALLLLTHKKEDPYFEYIKKISQNKIARNVKLSDLKDNMTLTRLKEIKQEDIQRIKKYKKAKEILMANA